MSRLKEHTIESLEETIQRSISYKSISPSLLMYLEVRDVRIARFSPDENGNVHIGKVRIYYNLGKLIKGDISAAIREVRLINSVFSIDQSRDVELIDTVRRMLGTGEAPLVQKNGRTLPENLAFIGENISIEYNIAGKNYEVNKLFFEFNILKNKIILKMKGDGTARFDEPFLIADAPLTHAEGRIEVQGQLTGTGRQITGRIKMKDFSSNLINFRALTLDALSTPEKISLRKIEDRSPYNFLFEYFPSEKIMDVKFEAEDFVPLDNIKPQKDLYPFSAWLNTVVSGASDIRYDTINRQFTYQGDLQLLVDNEFVPYPFSIDMKGAGNQDSVVLEKLSVQSEKLAALFTGQLFFDQLFAAGSINIQRFALNDRNILKGQAVIQGSRDNFLISSDAISIGEIRIQDIRVEGELDDKEVDFELQAGYHNGDEEDISPNITADGTLIYGFNSFLEVSMNGNKIPLTTSLKEFLPQRYARLIPGKNLYFSTSAYFTSNFDRYSFSLLPFTVADSDDVQVAVCGVNGNNERLRLSDVNMQIGEYNASGEFEISQNTEGAYLFQTALTINSIFYEINGVYFQPSTLILRGNNGLSASLIFGSDFTAFSAQTKNMPLPLVPGSVSELTFTGRGTVRNVSDWSVQLPVCVLTNIPGLPDDNSMEMAGSFGPGSMQINRLEYADSISSLSGSAQGFYRSSWPLEGEMQLILNDINNQEQYSITASRAGSQIEAEINIQNAPVSRIPDSPIDGILSTNTSVKGSIEKPQVNFSLKLDEGEYKQNLIQLESEGFFIDNELKLNYLHTEYNNHILQRGEGSINFENGRMSLTGQYRGIFMKKQSSAEITILGQLDQDKDIIPGQSEAVFNSLLDPKFVADIDIKNIQMFGKGHEDWTISTRRNSEALSFEGGPNNSLKGNIGKNGDFEFRLSEPLPVRFEVSGNRTPELFGASVEDIFIEADFLNLLGVRVIDFSSGLITGDLEITGAPNDPYFDGLMQVNGFSGKVQYVNGEIQPIKTRIEINEKTAVVRPVRVIVDGQSAELRGGFSFDRWNLETLDIYVRTLTPDGIPVLFRNPVSGLNIEGYSTGVFRFEMRPDKSTISGELTAQSCVITLQERQMGVPVMRVQPLVVDLKISTGRGVEFLWPRKNFPIIQAFADMGQNLSVYYDNITDSFQLKGQVELMSGEIYYFQRSFYIKEGSLTFNENEDKFDPLLLIDAQIKEIDNSGSPVTISLIVDNEPLSSFSPRFESNPGLSTTEIASILGTNIYTQFNQSEGELASALRITGDFFSQFGIVRSFEQQMKNVFNLDLFSIRTQMIQNVILERVLNQNITQDPESEGTVGSYLDNTTLFLGKYLGNDLFLEALVQIQQDPVAAGDFGQNELDLSMEVGLEWKTPFFLLNFSISPDFEEPMDSLQNTSLGFSWDFSY